MEQEYKPPKIIDGYIFVKDLGSGTFGNVYLFEQHVRSDLPRQIAMKIEKPRTGRNISATITREMYYLKLLHQ